MEHGVGDTPSRRLLEMDPIAVLNDGKPAREQWEAISDLDEYFARIYTYYRERGLQCILASRIISVMTIGYLLIFTIFLWFINWDGVVHQCTNETSCGHVAFFDPHWLRRASPFRVLYFFYFFLLFFLYWAWTLAQFVTELRPLYEMRAFYRDRLHLEDADLQVVSWDEIVVKLVELQRTSRLCIVKDQLTAHDIANRILRKQNFLVMLVNLELLPLDAPLGGLLPLPGAHRGLCMTRILEWNLYFTILDAMFDRQFRIRQSFTSDVANLRRRFVLCGCLNLLLAPFVIIFMLIFTLLKHAEEFRRRPAASAFGRDYSRHARWRMREYNELEHVFDARLASSGPDASAYVKQFPAPLMTLIARFITFVVGSLSSVLLLLSLGNEKLLLFFPGPLGLNLLTLLAILSTVLAVSHSFDGLAGENALVVPMQPSALLQSVARHTHHMPEHWRGREHTRAVYSDFCGLYQYRIVLLAQEVLGALTAPFLMIHRMPRAAGEILETLQKFTVYVEGVGHVCSFALFDFERHGDGRYGAPRSGPPSERAADGKMEKSYVSFRAAHPSWHDHRGEALMQNIAAAANVAALAAAEAAAAAAAAAAASSSATAAAMSKSSSAKTSRGVT